MFKFVIPFYYLTYSRLKSLPEKLSLLWIYPLFLMVFLFGFYNVEVIPNFLSFLMAIVAWMSIYEIGYLENDALTIKKETHPNLRIQEREINFIEKNFRVILITRFLIFGVIILIFFYSGLLSNRQLFTLISLIMLARLFFYMHNQIRSRWNILTYFVLCLLKYAIFPLVFLGLKFGFQPFIIILISFPILRTLEHAVKPKYKIVWLKKIIGSLDYFRVKYYAVTLILAILLSLGLGLTPIFIYSTAYFFVFRLGILLLMGTGKYSRESMT